MKLKTVEIKNFRLLKNVTVNVEDITTAIVGKNNSGKTAFGSVFRLFLSEKSIFSFEDISLGCHKRLFDLFKLYRKITLATREKVSEIIQRNFPKVSLKLTLEYSNQDNWSRVKPFITKLDNNNEIQIILELAPDSTINFFNDVSTVLTDITNPSEQQVLAVIENLISKFELKIRPDGDEVSVEDLKKDDILKLLRCHFIDAQRAVDDSSAAKGSKLSKVFQKHYELKNEDSKLIGKDLEDAVGTANENIDDKLKDFFKSFVESFNIFGFPGMQQQNLELKSNLDVSNMLKGNVKLYYNHANKYLSEKYNGLGFSNLIYIISEILSYQILNEKDERDLTVIFIEEPEAHMHPQMQDVFISQITKFIADKGFKVQLIISTHSSHIISRSEFSSIRYFSQKNRQTNVKDLFDFNREFSQNECINFLKQYLNLGECDLFFADKAILFEGTVERLLLPIFIEKLSAPLGANCLKKQYLARIEVGGAYMDKFKELLNFLELKTLLITDLDSVKKGQSSGAKPRTVYSACQVEAGDDILTSNSTLKKWIPGKEKISELIEANEASKVEGLIRVAYQNKQNDKVGRSFEEAFIIENADYIFKNKDELLSIENRIADFSTANEILHASYDIQEHIDKNSKKTNFAFDLITTNQDEWLVPTYIKEGLVWLAK